MNELPMWEQIVVDRRDSTSPFRQIANAIRHKIATNQVAASTPLPSVRSLATQLGVTPTTVARAYRDLKSEGLLESRVGVGTVVSDTKRLVYEAQQRSSEELERVIDQALSPLLKIGYAPSAIQQAVQRRLSRATVSHRALIISDARPIVEKYVSIMRRELTPLGVTVDGLLLEQLDHPTSEVNAILNETQRVLTSLGLRRSIEQALARLSINVPISVIFTELTLNTMERISAIPKDEFIVIVAEERYRNSALGILRQDFPEKNLTPMRNFSEDEFKRELAQHRYVVHSLGMSDVVRRHVTDEHIVIQMDYQVRPDALAKLRESFMVNVPSVST
jgi:GntR family transcriptional regulator